MSLTCPPDGSSLVDGDGEMGEVGYPPLVRDAGEAGIREIYRCAWSRSCVSNIKIFLSTFYLYLSLFLALLAKNFFFFRSRKNSRRANYTIRGSNRIILNKACASCLCLKSCFRYSIKREIFRGNKNV